MIAKKTSLSLLLFGIFYAAIACGDSYRCVNPQGMFEFTNRPCAANGSLSPAPAIPSVPKVESGAAPKKSANTPQIKEDAIPSASNVHQDNLRYLDKKVDEAIKYDLRAAKQLALTPEHWRKIRAAEENFSKPVVKTSAELQTTAPQQQVQMQQAQPQLQQQQVTQQQVLEQGGLTSQQQLKLQQLQQQKMQQEEEQKQWKLQKIQQQVIQQEQQRQQQVQQHRQACQSQVQSQYQNQRASLRRSMEGAGMSQSSMLTVLDQNFARDSALCNSIK